MNSTETIVLLPGPRKWSLIVMLLVGTVPVLTFSSLILYASVSWLLVDFYQMNYLVSGLLALLFVYASVYTLALFILKVHWADTQGALILTHEGVRAPAWRNMSYAFVPQKEPSARWDDIEEIVSVGATGASFSAVRFVLKNRPARQEGLHSELTKRYLERILRRDAAVITDSSTIQVMYCLLPSVPNILTALEKYPVKINRASFGQQYFE